MKTTSVRVGEHDLIIAVGDCEFHGSCACGKSFGTITPDVSYDEFGKLHERHVMTETEGYPDLGDGA